MNRRLIVILLWSAFAFATSRVHADELYESYLSARALGMGDAYTSIVDDTDALFYNPGALCRLHGFTWEVVDPMLAAGGYQNLSAVENFRSATSPSSTVSAIEGFYGKHLSGDFSMKSAIALPCFALEGSAVTDVTISMNNPPFPSLDLVGGADYAEGGGIAVPIVPHFFSIGVAVQHITRYGSTVPIGPGTLVNLNSTSIQNSLYSNGYGWGVSSGVLFHLHGVLNPRFSFVETNIGDTSFISTSSAGAPSRIPQETIAGAGLDYESELLSIRSAIDFKHLEMASEQLGKKVHIGIEFAFPMLSFRGGFYQGYYTLGAGVNLGWFRVDAATYGVEMGAYPGQDEDRRYAVQARVQLSFDPDFDFTLNGPANEGLKLRR